MQMPNSPHTKSPKPSLTARALRALRRETRRSFSARVAAVRGATLPALVLTAALAACSPDASREPLAPSAPSLARGGHGDAATKAKRIHGTLEATETGVFRPGTPPLSVRHLEGTGTASHLGRFTVVADFTLNLATFTGGGSVTYTAANGDVLTGTATGRAVVGGGIAAVTETVTITGGTGRFAGATGTLTLVRRVVQATGTSSGTIEGTIMIRK